MDYILVQNNSIVGYPRPLPQNWMDVSNFHVLEEERIRQYGWFPVRVVTANKSETDVVTGQRFEITENEVIQYEEIRQKTQSELQDEIDGKWDNIKQERDKLLTETDWTQLADVVLKNLDEWRKYRQELRDITSQPDPNQIIWPTKPI